MRRVGYSQTWSESLVVVGFVNMCDASDVSDVMSERQRWWDSDNIRTSAAKTVFRGHSRGGEGGQRL